MLTKQQLFSLMASAMLATAGSSAIASDTVAQKVTVSDWLAQSSASDWRELDSDNTLYMELPTGRVVIELASEFAPKHISNIKALVREGFYQNIPIVRVQDNYVVQWNEPDDATPKALKQAKRSIAAEFSVKLPANFAFTPLADRDGYAPQTGHVNGFAMAMDPGSNSGWLTHCYGAVGIGRDNDADSGSGASMYVVTGHAPRHLDRNITLVGTVRQGMSLLSTLPRGQGDMGFYTSANQYTVIKDISLAADLPPAQRAALQVLRTDTATFKGVVEAQRNRGGDWYQHPAGFIEVCNVRVPVRETPVN
ncbi:peptidylprolyl isomerase [Rheinheimera baltica]|uniref:peptidylprolyl isomerase n=1 Tax=Rheinheimera baltica TaxID=67576 RepID=A0ABT9I5B0_9GAMM|nr:peptidylprolyl isomerase [Rheinheimera baltica]MDP5138583.1 peptidylprolyl isomerase [Rheinheimera baltica]MDP5150424.1 peptidylprolyl isomerase [Rheinheimera baltica]